MVSPLVYNIKVSSIGPADVTGSDLIYEPSNLDLAMKLHYLKGIYYFGSRAFEGLTTLVIKEPMFIWLNKYPMTCGRFRRAESGRPYIKCNDCGARFLEGKCEKTLDEWLQMTSADASLENHLFPNQLIGPELGFSPLVLIQLTKFKCGGTAVGLSWAHVLGDIFSADEFLNALGQTVAGHDLGQPVELTNTQMKSTPSMDEPVMGLDPLSIKRVGPVGDNWVNVTKIPMEVFSFNVTPAQLGLLQSKLSPNGPQFSPFEAISSIIWKCVARIRGQENEPSVVTICKKNGKGYETSGALGNRQVVSVVKVDFPIVDVNLSKLASIIKTDALEENKRIEEAIEREPGSGDFIVYGANLTFVDLEGGRFYEFEYREQKPVNVSYRISGAGEQGAVLVLPDGQKDGGRKVMAIFGENEIVELKSELQREGINV